MLKRVEIENFHGFKDRIVFDFYNTKNYSYSQHLLKNKMVKNSIVFGKNGSGKSSLCLGLIDITLHLLDRQKDKALKPLYTYLGNNNETAEFLYVFKFGKKEISYLYRKINPLTLTYEEVKVNGRTILLHDYLDETKNFIKIPGAISLQTNGLQQELSCVKYVYNNTIHHGDSELNQMMNFVSGMLYFRSLREGNEYIGFKLGGEDLDDIILRNDKLSEFNDFLNETGLNYNLVPIKFPNGIQRIGIKFDNGKVVVFNDIASSGTQALKLFYCWLLDFSELSFLIIDEFDAFYSYETSKSVLDVINRFTNMQSLVTTHNVTLLSTDCSRPDCTYLLDESGISSLSSRSEKDLRKSNNIEKLYREGYFSKCDK